MKDPHFWSLGNTLVRTSDPLVPLMRWNSCLLISQSSVASLSLSPQRWKKSSKVQTMFLSRSLIVQLWTFYSIFSKPFLASFIYIPISWYTWQKNVGPPLAVEEWMNELLRVPSENHCWRRQLSVKPSFLKSGPSLGCCCGWTRKVPPSPPTWWWDVKACPAPRPSGGVVSAHWTSVHRRSMDTGKVSEIWMPGSGSWLDPASW